MPKGITRKFAARVAPKMKMEAKKAKGTEKIRSLVLGPLGVGEPLKKGLLVGMLTIPVHEMHDSIFLKRRLKEVTPWRMKQDEFLAHMGVESVGDLPKYMQNYIKKKKLKSFSRKELANFLSHPDTIELIARANLLKKGEEINPISKRYTKEGEAPDKILSDIFDRIGDKRRKAIALRVGTGTAAGVFIVGTGLVAAHEAMKRGIIPDVEVEQLKQVGNFIYGPVEHVYDAAGGIISQQGVGPATEPSGGGGISDHGSTPEPSGGGGEPGGGLLRSLRNFLSPERNLREGKLPLRGVGTAAAGAGGLVLKGVAGKLKESFSIRKNALDHLDLLNIAADAPYGKDGFKRLLKPGSKLARNEGDLQTMQALYNSAIDNKQGVMVWYDEVPLSEMPKDLQNRYKPHAKKGKIAVVNWAIPQKAYPGRSAKIAKRKASA